MEFLTETAPGELLLRAHIQPKAVKSQIVGLYDGCLKIAIKAPPVDGKANSELIRFLAALCGIRKNQLEIKSGSTSRRKQILIRVPDHLSVTRILKEQLQGV